MKNILYLIAFFPLCLFGQIRADQLPEITNPQDTDAFYTAERGSFRKITLSNLSNYFESGAVDSFYLSNDTVFLQTTSDLMFVVLPASEGSGITDGDKGDITVASSGANWQIDPSTIGSTELASTSVTAGSYTNANITVDADGRITTASNGSVNDADSDSNNELQTLSLSGSDLTLSDGGGTVTLPSGGSGGVLTNESLDGDGTAGNELGLLIGTDNYIPRFRASTGSIIDSYLRQGADGIGINISPANGRQLQIHNSLGVITYAVLTNTTTGSGPNDGFQFVSVGNDIALINREIGGNMNFRVNDSESRVYLNSNGVGIQNTNPQATLHLGGNPSLRINPHTSTPTGSLGVTWVNSSTSSYLDHNGTEYLRRVLIEDSTPGDKEVPVWNSSTARYESEAITHIIPLYAQSYNSALSTGSDYQGWRVPSDLGQLQIIGVQYSLQTPGSGTVDVQLTNGTVNFGGGTIPVNGILDISTTRTLVNGELIKPSIVTINGSGHQGLMINLLVKRI